MTQPEAIIGLSALLRSGQAVADTGNADDDLVAVVAGVSELLTHAADEIVEHVGVPLAFAPERLAEVGVRHEIRCRGGEQLEEVVFEAGESRQGFLPVDLERMGAAGENDPAALAQG